MPPYTAWQSLAPSRPVPLLQRLPQNSAPGTFTQQREDLGKNIFFPLSLDQQQSSSSLENLWRTADAVCD